jgi:hypothetical protein
VVAIDGFGVELGGRLLGPVPNGVAHHTDFKTIGQGT